MNMTMRLADFSWRIRLPASHQYQSGYPDEILVMIWTWYVVIASTASSTWVAAADRTSDDKRADSAGLSARERPRPVLSCSTPDLTNTASIGAASRKSGRLDTVQ